MERPSLGSLPAVRLRERGDPGGPDYRNRRVVNELPPVLAAGTAFRSCSGATISVWGEYAQNDIARTRVGIIGLGSAGIIVAEALSRVGFSDLLLLDFDHIKIRNLDRTMHATHKDAESETKKVHVAGRGIADSHTAADVTVRAIPDTFLSEAGVLAALDCDVLVSCVDRPWPGWILNGLAYAHLVPVVDGGGFRRGHACRPAAPHRLANPHRRAGPRLSGLPRRTAPQ